jgi:hypothetical protein
VSIVPQMKFFILPQFRLKNFILPQFRAKILFYHNSAANFLFSHNSAAKVNIAKKDRENVFEASEVQTGPILKIQSTKKCGKFKSEHSKKIQSIYSNTFKRKINAGNTCKWSDL